MKTFNVVGKFEVALAYDMETELEIVLKNENLEVDEWADDTGRLTGSVVIRDLDFDVLIDAETEQEAKETVLADLETGWNLEDGVTLVEVNLVAIEITEEPEEAE